MAILGVDDMKAKLVGGGARPNLFKVTMAFPSYVTADVSLASYMCKAASLPASTIANIEVPFRGRKLQIAGDRSFEPWSVTVINDTDFNVRNSFEQWMNGINQHNENTGLTQPSSYMADMSVEQLDKDGTVKKTYNMRGTWPTSLGAIEVGYENESVIEEFPVELQVQYWESDKTT
jgi:hypothetical protein|tara:strand:- start:1918 stop:2445 length:528 start_codon:yes stop_codon:yes gene_type:complete